MSTDKRAAVLRWIEEQEALCAAATPGPWQASRAKTLGVLPPAEHRVPYSDGTSPHIATVWDMAFEHRKLFAGRITAGSAEGNLGLILASRSVLPLALAALRAEVEAHVTGEGDVCHNCTEPVPCPTIERIYASLGLDPLQEGR